MVARLIYTPVCSYDATDSNGQATLRIRVPGTFGGTTFDPGSPVPGRFLKSVQVWCDTPTNGDRVYDMRLEDDNSILAAIPDPLNPGHMVSERFASYPTIYKFSEASPSSPATSGLYVTPSNYVICIEGIDKSQSDFAPAGFSFVVDYQNAVLIGKSGKIVRANLYWGTWQTQ